MDFLLLVMTLVVNLVVNLAVVLAVTLVAFKWRLESFSNLKYAEKTVLYKNRTFQYNLVASNLLTEFFSKSSFRLAMATSRDLKVLTT